MNQNRPNIKAFKERFGIEHIVCVEEGTLVIRSPYMTLAKIRLDNGGVELNESIRTGNHSDSVNAICRLVHVAPHKIAETLQIPWTPSAELPVWTYAGGRVTRQLCEEYGWPNVTLDGELMYQNTHFRTRAEALRYAKRNCRSGIRSLWRCFKDDVCGLCRRVRWISRDLFDLFRLYVLRGRL